MNIDLIKNKLKFKEIDDLIQQIVVQQYFPVPDINVKYIYRDIRLLCDMYFADTYTPFYGNITKNNVFAQIDLYTFYEYLKSKFKLSNENDNEFLKYFLIKSYLFSYKRKDIGNYDKHILRLTSFMVSLILKDSDLKLSKTTKNTCNKFLNKIINYY